jgi:hypothetical protein
MIDLLEKGVFVESLLRPIEWLALLKDRCIARPL